MREDRGKAKKSESRGFGRVGNVIVGFALCCKRWRVEVGSNAMG